MSCPRKQELGMKPRLKVGKIYVNGLGERFYIVGVSNDDQVTIQHINTGCLRRLPQPFLAGELHEETPAPLLDRAAGWALAVVVCLLIVGWVLL